MRKKIRILGLLLVILLVISLSGSGLAASAAPAVEGIRKGIDVSRFNGFLDWELVKSQGIDFVMIKTANGKDVGDPSDIDPQFENNYIGAGEVGIDRGVYHVISGRTVEDAILEAEYCLKILDGRPLEYPIAYDVESSKSMEESVFSTGKDNITAMAIAFCETIKAAGYTPMIYTYAEIYNKYLDYDQIKDYKLWVAHYDVEDPGIEHPYQIWQYGQESIEGANNSEGLCDVNYEYDYIPTREILIDSKLVLRVGEKLFLPTIIVPASTSDKVTYKSMNKKIATVTATGRVKAKKVGKVRIRIKTSNGITTYCTIVVRKPQKSNL